jgi:REP element-mobilizing transposase RayT
MKLTASRRGECVHGSTQTNRSPEGASAPLACADLSYAACRSICGKARLSVSLPKNARLAAAELSVMFKISRDHPAYYLTSVTHHRLPIFQTERLKQVFANAFDEARLSAGLLLFAYVIMPDHTHVMTDDAREMKDVLRFLNGISARRIINHLKEHDLESSLQKLRIVERKDEQKYSVYEHHPNAFRITGEDAFIAKGELHSPESRSRRASRAS